MTRSSTGTSGNKGKENSLELRPIKNSLTRGILDLASPFKTTMPPMMRANPALSIDATLMEREAIKTSTALRKKDVQKEARNVLANYYANAASYGDVPLDVFYRAVGNVTAQQREIEDRLDLELYNNLYRMTINNTQTSYSALNSIDMAVWQNKESVNSMWNNLFTNIGMDLLKLQFDL